MGPRLFSREEEELSSRHNKRMLLMNLLVLLAIFVAVTFIIPNGSHQNLFIWEDTQLRISCPDDSVHTVAYADITRMALVENADLGTCLSGDSSSNYCYGIWENDQLGEYVLCAYRSFSTVIQISTAEEDYWISYESAETTQGLYDSIVRTLCQEGYVFETGNP